MKGEQVDVERARARWLAAEAAYREMARRYEDARPGERRRLAARCALLLTLANEAEQDYLQAVRLSGGRSRA